MSDETSKSNTVKARLPRGLAALALAQAVVALWTASPWGVGQPTTCEQAALAGAWAFSGASSALWAVAAIAVLAVPAAAAQDVSDRLVAAGVTSILNFSPAVCAVPDGVSLRKVDLAIELQILSFYQLRRALPGRA